jgi:hypothetical protein
VEDIIRTIGDDIAWLAALPTSVWISVALTALLGLSLWRYVRLWQAKNATEERVLAKLVDKEMRTWSEIANDLRNKSEITARIARQSVVNHLEGLNASFEARIRSDSWLGSHDHIRELLRLTAHAMSTPGMEQNLIDTCAEMIRARLKDYPDVAAAGSILPSDAAMFLFELNKKLETADLNGTIRRTQASLMDTAHRIDPDFTWQQMCSVAQ